MMVFPPLLWVDKLFFSSEDEISDLDMFGSVIPLKMYISGPSLKLHGLGFGHVVQLGMVWLYIWHILFLLNMFDILL